MAEKSKEKKNNKGGRKRLDISMLAIIDNMVFNKTDKWAYYRISNSVYDFLSVDAKIALGARIIGAFTNLMAERQDDLECHIMVVSTPVDVDAWEAQVREVSQGWNRAPGFNAYVKQQADYLRAEEFSKKVVYLGVNLGKRGALNMDTTSLIEGGLTGAKEIIGGWVKEALKTPDKEISAKEEAETRLAEVEIHRTLSTGNFNATRATAEELLLCMKRQLYPTMPTPYLDIDYDGRIGPGDLDLEMASAINNRLRWLEISQMVEDQEFTGYRAALTIAKLPKEIDFPERTIPFMYFLNAMGLSFSSYARFKLKPTNTMRKELEKKKKETKDELENLANGGGTVDSAIGATPTEVVEALEDMQLLNSMLAGNRTPWVEGVYRIVVEMPTEDSLKDMCATLKQHYSDLNIQLQLTAGDQKDLFLEQMPGDKIRMGSHTQITDLAYLSTSGFNFSGDVGDLIIGSDAAIGE